MKVFCPYCGLSAIDRSPNSDQRSERYVTCTNSSCGYTSLIAINDDPSLMDNQHGHTERNSGRNKVLGASLILVGVASLFTNLFGLGAGWGMVVFFATAFPGLLLACGAFTE